jgi:signal transduction histidine kinase
MIHIRTIQARIALAMGVAVLASVTGFAAATITGFLWVEQSEAETHRLSPAAQQAEDQENLDMIRRFGGALVLAIPVVTAGGAAFGLWLAGRALAPMREAASRANAARRSSLDLRLPVQGTGSEWDDLAAVMNELLLDQNRSIAREKAFAANAAHELRTPLTTIRGEVEIALRRERDGAYYRESLETIGAEVLRLSALVDVLLVLARADLGDVRGSWTEFDLADVAADAIRRANGTDRSIGKAIELDAVPTVVRGDPLLTGRILDNLLENALRHATRTVSLHVAAHQSLGATAVYDDGPGLSSTARARLFERFNKDPGTSNGFGLGLAIAHAFALSQNGQLRLDEGAPRTCFVLDLPLVGTTAPSADDQATGKVPRSATA